MNITNRIIINKGLSSSNSSSYYNYNIYGSNGGNLSALRNNSTKVTNYVGSQNGANNNVMTNLSNSSKRVIIGSNRGNPSAFNKESQDNTNKENNRKILSIPKREETKTTNVIDYNDYIKNPKKYNYNLTNNTPAYVSALYEKYKVFNSNNMQGLLGSKFGSQTTFDDGQRSLIKTLERYYFTVSDDEIAYISSSDGKVYLKNGLIFFIKNNLITSISDLNTNSQYFLEPNKTFFHKYVDRKSSTEYWMNEGNLTNISIFDSANLSSSQYGGDQGAFSKNAEQLLQDPQIINRLKEYYPDATMEDYHLYLCKLNACGCGYTALVNTVFYEYQGSEAEFQQKFGYPMYTVNSEGEADYNYEYMILDFFNYIWGDSGFSIRELYGNVSLDAVDGSISGTFDTGKADGTSDDTIGKFSNFLQEKYDCNVNIDIGTPDTIYSSYGKINKDNAVLIYNNLKNDDNQIYFCGQGYDLYNMDGSLYLNNGGSHAMYVTDVTDSGQIIVSSWGKQYILGLDAFGKGYNRDDKYLCFKVVDFNN